MSNFTVTIPIVGSISYEVTAKDRAEAEKKTWDRFNDGDEDNALEWEAVERVCEGNVCHATTNSVEVTEHAPEKARKAKR